MNNIVSISFLRGVRPYFHCGWAQKAILDYSKHINDDTKKCFNYYLIVHCCYFRLCSVLMTLGHFFFPLKRSTVEAFLESTLSLASLGYIFEQGLID